MRRVALLWTILIAGCDGAVLLGLELDAPSPSLSAIDPVVGFAGNPHDSVLVGSALLPRIFQDLDEPGGLGIATDFSAFLDDEPLGDVLWIDEQTLTATIPAGVAAGVYDVRIVTPLGFEATLPGAYTSSSARPPVVDALSPDVVVAGGPSTVEVRGADFQDGLKASLDDVLLTTSDVTETNFSVIIPGDTATGDYPLTVRNPDGQRALNAPRLRVVAPVILDVSVALEYTTVTVGQRVAITVTVQNVGDTAALDVTPTATPGGDGGVDLEASPSPGPIAAGGSASFVLEYTTTAAGSVAFDVEVTGVNDLSGGALGAVSARSPTLTIEDVPGLIASPALSRDVVSVGQQVELAVQLTHGGGAALRTVVAASVATPEAALSLDSGPGAPVELDDESSASFTFAYTAQSAGSVTLSASGAGEDRNSGATIAASAVEVALLVEERANLSAELVLSSTAVQRGETIDLDLVVNNTGEASALGVVPVFDLVGGFTISGPVPASDDIAGGGSTVFAYSLLATSVGAAAVSASAVGVNQNSVQDVASNVESADLLVESRCTDGDGDGFGRAGTDQSDCTFAGDDCDDGVGTCTTDCTNADGDSLALCAGDCDDSVATGVGCTAGCAVFFADSDSDNFGDAASPSASLCTAPANHVANSGDCDDGVGTCTTDCTNADGDALALCAGDCDDSVATGGGCTAGCTTFFRDADGDTFGTLTNTASTCVAGTGFVSNSQDCADTPGSDPVCGGLDGSFCNPLSAEGPFGDPTCSDGADNDCDTTVDLADTACTEASVTLVFDNLNIAEDLINFPVLVTLTPTNFSYATAEPDGADLIFFDEDTTNVLPHEIDTFVPGGTSHVWVLVPLIDADSATDFITLTYGDLGAATGEDPASLWADYGGVWHLGETADNIGNDYLDSTLTGHNAQGGGGVANQVPTLTPGLVGGAQLFDGVNDEILIDPSTDFNHVSDVVTVEYTMNQNPDGGFMICVGKGGSPGGYRSGLESDGTVGWFVSGTLRDTTFQPPAFETHNIVVVYDLGNRMRTYVDGVERLNASGPANLQNSNDPLFIGRAPSAANWRGMIDEVRISERALTAPWIEASQRSMTNTYISFL